MNDTDGWSPEDGAGYIPTEEGGSGREANGMERVNLSSDTLDLLDQYRSDDGGRESYDSVIQQILREKQEAGSHV